MLLIRSGTVLHFSITQHIPSVPFERGAVVGHVTGVLNATTSVTWRVIATTGINAPDWTWKLFQLTSRPYQAVSVRSAASRSAARTSVS